MNLYKSSSISIINSKDINKPNEDYYFCDDERGIYLLVDGVSRDKIDGVYPNPSPASDVSKLFVESAYNFLINNIDNDAYIIELLCKAMEIGNKTINDYNSKIKWNNNFFPGTVGIIVIVRDKKMFYAYIGDCYGLIVNKDKNIFTECQTINITKHKKQFSAYEIRNVICNNKIHPYSYGVLNGDMRALDFVNCGSRDICDDDKILICSDGFSDIIELLSANDMYKLTVNQMVEFSRDSDDKTMITIEVNTDDKENV